MYESHEPVPNLSKLSISLRARMGRTGLTVQGQLLGLVESPVWTFESWDLDTLSNLDG